MTPEQRIRSLRDLLHRRTGERAALQDRIEAEGVAIDTRDASMECLKKAIEVLQAASETRRQELRDRVEALITRGLQAVFGRPDYVFTFEVSMSRGVFTMRPMLRSKFKDRVIEKSILDGHGGGIADVVSFLLRVVVLTLSRPRRAPVLMLDEPFRHAASHHLRGIGDLLRELNRSAGIQFVIVTHQPELMDAADVVYRSELGEDNHTEFVLEHDLRDELYHAEPTERTKAPDRRTSFDGEPDPTAPINDAESVESETVDPRAVAAREVARLKGKRKK